MRHSIRSHPPDDLRARHRLARTPSALPGTGAAERAMLAAVILPDTKADLSNPLGELTALAEAAGTEVVDSLIQKRMRMGASSALGKGKMAELVQRADDADADVIIFDNDLTPRQIRTLEKAATRKVIDRSELILDIFALRARTREAQLQVELAQLEYTAPRIRGMWTHLERIAGAGGATKAGAVGGVGTRGPGERQIEIDRRIVKKRIGYLKTQIAEIDRRKKREVRSRSNQFAVSLVGYTNSGKSTLLNKLTGAKRYTADQLFATLDTKTVRWDVADGMSALISDTVGFVRDLPHHLVASFRATLEETIHADLLLHVVDISSPRAWQEAESVDEVLKSLDCQDIPQITMLNKHDIADDASMAEMLSRHRTESLLISALTGEGLDDLRRVVLEHMQRDNVELTVLIPHADGKVVGEIMAIANVKDRRYIVEGVELDICLSRSQFLQLQGRYATIQVLAGDVGGDDASDAEVPK